jgi:SAM-dependent methyltransferase
MKAASIPAQVTGSAWTDRLACPRCEGVLNNTGETLRCDRCRVSWPVQDEVPQFVEDFPYWGEIPQETMRVVNDRAAKGSWRGALLDLDDPVVKRASEMILNLDRANWHWMMDLPPNSRVLDLGAGTGANAHALGKRFQEVVALEPVRERIDFMRRRFSQEGLTNVKPLRSSLWVLPFAKNSFDMVAMNGVLEWVAVGQEGNPKELQTRALQNVYRMLKQDGYFYLGIENRLALGYFAGYPDPHCGLPWATILPRPLADRYVRRRGQTEGYRNYLYSGGGYRKLLESVGFNRIEIYLALPSYNDPRFFIPLKGHTFDYYSRHFLADSTDWRRRWFTKTLSNLGVLKHLQYSFAILARK